MAKGNEYLHARLLLAARGIEPEPRTLAGALLEVERDRLIVGFIRGMARTNG
jgi:hypothetical protein